MKTPKNTKTWFSIVTLSLSLGALLAGCSNPDGEGLSDQQKLDGASKARAQQMSGQKAESNAPMTRDSMPGQNKP
jgi:hypothetical protein